MQRLLLIILLFAFASISSQTILTGTVQDKGTKETLPGVTLALKSNLAVGAVSDYAGNFRIKIPAGTSLPVTLLVSYVGYEKKEIPVSNSTQKILILLETVSVGLGDVDVVAERLRDKQKLAPLTVENFDLRAIKETPAISFYDGLGQLKGVDVTAASIGFKVINTRGFNSTSPVRSLQLIDGVDNQAPGLNFSLGNFLGSSEIDVKNVDLIQGASSAYYGPNAFNGVISMNTKSPFTSPGLAVLMKAGERGLTETAIRWADCFKYKDGKDKFGYKLNLYYMHAHDWEATNYDPIDNSKSPKTNPGGYNAVNRYGDEYSSFQDYSDSGNYFFKLPGLGTFYRPGYEEKDIVDYNSRNLKANIALHYKLKNGVEFIAASNYGNGTTVYQGENRLSLKDIRFYQNRIEARKENKWFVQAYATNENAGNSYDAVLTAMMIQQLSKPNDKWAIDYYSYWYANIDSKVHALPGFPKYVWPYPYNYAAADSVLRANTDKLDAWHKLAMEHANSANPTFGYTEYLKPGTKAFDSLFTLITSRNISLDKDHYGSRFYDRSALYHIKGEYIFNTSFGDITTGGNFRIYKPNSQGTIFSDTGNHVITNREFGAYSGLEKKVLDDKLKINLTLRMDKNQNFNYNFSPAASLVYSYSNDRIFRVSFSSAIRNPTLLDQYLFYNVGPAILIGNVNGFNRLMTVNSFIDVLNKKDTAYARRFNVAPVQPEKVKTVEFGFRGTFWKKLYLDAGYYYSAYHDFIGYKIGVDASFDSLMLPTYQVYRVAANAKDRVTTQGISFNTNFYFCKYFILGGNYSWNKLNQFKETDSIIPAYNTPEHKFNVSIGGRDFEGKYLGFFNAKGWGFNVNYKWVQGFVFEGSPQFTGKVPTYSSLDGQINYNYAKWNTTFKLGASNILNKKFFQVYGGPYTARLMYFSVLYDWVRDKKR